MNYVAYYRVGHELLGNSWRQQQTECTLWAIDNQHNIIKEYAESEGDIDRGSLELAVERAKREGATLLVTKLDRISTSLSAIATLCDGVPLRVINLPEGGDDCLASLQKLTPLAKGGTATDAIEVRGNKKPPPRRV